MADAGLITDRLDKEPTVTRSDSPKPGDDEKDRDPSPPPPAEPLPEEDLEQVRGAAELTAVASTVA